MVRTFFGVEDPIIDPNCQRAVCRPNPGPGRLWSNIKHTVLELLLDHAEYAHQEMRNGNRTEALRCFVEHSDVLRELVKTGYPEFRADLEAIDARLDRLKRDLRTSLMQDYVRSGDPAQVMSVGELLGEFIADDMAWDWQAEFNVAVEEQQGRLRDVRAFA
jgi:hypothetical protein